MTPRRDNWLSFCAILAVVVGGILASSMPVNASALEDARAAFAKQDYAVGVAKFQEAVDQGDPEALALMGTMYDDGIGVPYDHEKAFSLNMKAAEQGRVDAQFHVAMAYAQRSTKTPDRESREREIAEWLKWFKMAAIGAAPKAENGDPIAQWILGELYYFGRGGLNRDNSKAISWLVKAADKVVSAQFRLGMIYETGGRGTEDPQKAREWYAKAALAGHAGAASRLAPMLEKSGEKEEAKLLYAKAALAGDPIASAMLRDHYNIHLGDPKEFDQMQADLRAKEAVFQTDHLINFGGVALGIAVLSLMGTGDKQAPSANSEYEYERQRIESRQRLLCDSAHLFGDPMARAMPGCY